MTSVDFDPFSREFFDDPFATYARMREEAPCFHSDRWDFYAFSRFADIAAIHLDTENFTSTHGLIYEHLIDPDFDPGINRSMIMMDPPEHNRYRRLVSRSFTPRAMAGYRDKVRVLIRSYLDPLMDQDGFDMVEDFAAPFPVEIICAILGVPEADRQMIRLQTDAMLHREEGQSEASPAQIEAAIGQAVYFLDFVAAKRKRPAEDMCSALIE
ncbi:MAG: cytochrome P450, partial [Actinomycetota bacterium]|nr:cytochrome P450 [Actinomycetota bacterium]MED6329724.1 cytochrome P450 [Actinomycetota bacterium]